MAFSISLDLWDEDSSDEIINRRIHELVVQHEGTITHLTLDDPDDSYRATVVLPSREAARRLYESFHKDDLVESFDEVFPY